MLPLPARSDDGCTLLAPLDSPHEQLIGLENGSLVWGWHGDLDRVEPGFATVPAPD